MLNPFSVPFVPNHSPIKRNTPQKGLLICDSKYCLSQRFFCEEDQGDQMSWRKKIAQNVAQHIFVKINPKN
jgi:hypothetical protein